MSSAPLPPSGPNFLLPPRRRSRRKRIATAVVVSALLLIVLWSCGKGTYHNYRLARAAVETFHQQLDQGDYDAIYEETTDEFRRTGKRGDTVKFFEMVHQKMGNSGKMSVRGFHIKLQNGTVFVDEVYGTHFAQGEAQESFIWIVRQEQPRLHAYHIDSPNLR